MGFRKLSEEEKQQREQLDIARDRFVSVLEVVGWLCLIGFCLFFAKMCGQIP